MLFALLIREMASINLSRDAILMSFLEWDLWEYIDPRNAYADREEGYSGERSLWLYL